jgi:DNA-binding Lrp family transcriptional regulator
MQATQPSASTDLRQASGSSRVAHGIAQYSFADRCDRLLMDDTQGTTAVRARLDAIDWKILKELQDEGRITNVELARRVGISAPPCLRRVRALEEAGFIRGYRALLDEKSLGYEVTVFAMVHLSSQAEADLKAFEDFVRKEPLVRECWMLSGEIDFLLKCVAPDLKTFQAFVAELTAAPHVRNVKTSLTLRNAKDAAMVPMDLKG